MTTGPHADCSSVVGPSTSTIGVRPSPTEVVGASNKRTKLSYMVVAAAGVYLPGPQVLEVNERRIAAACRSTRGIAVCCPASVLSVIRSSSVASLAIPVCRTQDKKVSDHTRGLKRI